MGWIQEGVRDLFERTVDDWIVRDMKKTVLRQRERLLKMEHLAKMEVDKDAGMGWIQGGVRNLFGSLDKAVCDWIDEDVKKTVLRERERLLKMEHLAKMEVGKDAGMGWIQGGVRNLFGSLDKAVCDWIDEDVKKMVPRELAKGKAWKLRNQGRLDKMIDDWNRDHKKWVDGDLKKISKGTLELELRRLELERKQLKFFQWHLVSLQPMPYRMVSGMMSLRSMPYRMVSGMMSLRRKPYHMVSGMMMDDDSDDDWAL